MQKLEVSQRYYPPLTLSRLNICRFASFMRRIAFLFMKILQISSAGFKRLSRCLMEMKKQETKQKKMLIQIWNWIKFSIFRLTLSVDNAILNCTDSNWCILEQLHIIYDGNNREGKTPKVLFCAKTASELTLLRWNIGII